MKTSQKWGIGISVFIIAAIILYFFIHKSKSKSCINDCTHGTCKDGTCICSTGWKGDDCSKAIPSCPNNCTSPDNGTCDHDTMKCTCKGTWLGNDCSITPKECPKNCTSPDNGTCDPIKGICTCKDDWVGKDCSIKSKNCTKTCTKNQTCNRETGECICSAGWKGDDCTIEQNPCPKNCTSPDNGTCDPTKGICTCKDDWIGKDCSTRSAKCVNDCTSPANGTCDGETGICTCNPDYRGADCSEQALSCTPACSEYATCDGETGVCKCKPNYQGPDCRTPCSSAFGSPCGGGKVCCTPLVCDAKSSNPSCICPAPDTAKTIRYNTPYYLGFYSAQTKSIRMISKVGSNNTKKTAQITWSVTNNVKKVSPDMDVAITPNSWYIQFESLDKDNSQGVIKNNESFLLRFFDEKENPAGYAGIVEYSTSGRKATGRGICRSNFPIDNTSDSINGIKCNTKNSDGESMVERYKWKLNPPPAGVGVLFELIVHARDGHSCDYDSAWQRCGWRREEITDSHDGAIDCCSPDEGFTYAVLFPVINKSDKSCLINRV